MKLFALNAIAFCTAMFAVSQSAMAMDLLQAYKGAQSQDSTILASRAGAQAGLERLPQARSQFLPSVNASVGRNANGLASSSLNALGQPQRTDSNYKSGNDTLTLRQPLYRAALSAQYRQALAQIDEVNSTLELEEQNLAVRVCGAYFDALLTDEQLAMVQTQRSTLVTQLDAARKALIAGSGTRTDVDEAQARLDMNHAQEIEVRQNVEYTKRQLFSLTGESVDNLSRLDVTQFTPEQPTPTDVNSWLEKAERTSPQMKTLAAQLAIARQEIEKNRAGHYPTVDAVLQWNRSESENVSNITSSYTNASVGVQLNIPLYSGGYVSSTVRQAVANQERAYQAMEAGRRELALRVNKEFRGVAESIPKIKAYEQALRSADQLVLSSKKSYQAGTRTVIDVLNANQQRMTVLHDLAQARYMYLISKIRLLSLVGEASTEAVTAMNQLFSH